VPPHGFCAADSASRDGLRLASAFAEQPQVRGLVVAMPRPIQWAATITRKPEPETGNPASHSLMPSRTTSTLGREPRTMNRGVTSSATTLPALRVRRRSWPIAGRPPV
jgi:hypothetical protein